MIFRDYLIIGAGVAGVSVCEGIRQYDPKGSILLIGAEPDPPTERYRLSKDYLSDPTFSPAKIWTHPPEWYATHQIELRLSTYAKSFNIERRMAVLQNGQSFEFRKACLATGSRPLRPQVAGSGLGNIFYPRTLRDMQALRESLNRKAKILVIGGGLLALEVASSLRATGASVTLLCREKSLLSQWLDPIASEWLTEQFRRSGVEIRAGESLNGFEGKTILKNVQTKSGDRIPADLAVVAIGTEMNLELVHNTPLASPGGTPVNEYLESDEKGIFAAGDIALYPDKIFGSVRRLTHWESSRQQGLLAGANMTGKKRQKFLFVPAFSTRFFETEIHFVGDILRPTNRQSTEGDIATGHFKVVRSSGEKVVSAMLVNPRAGQVDEIRDQILRSHS